MVAWGGPSQTIPAFVVPNVAGDFDYDTMRACYRISCTASSPSISNKSDNHSLSLSAASELEITITIRVVQRYVLLNLSRLHRKKAVYHSRKKIRPINFTRNKYSCEPKRATVSKTKSSSSNKWQQPNMKIKYASNKTR